MNGPELLEQITLHPTLDLFMDRDPHAHPLSEEELRQLVEVMRKERAAFLVSEQKKKEKKQGIDIQEEPENED